MKLRNSTAVNILLLCLLGLSLVAGLVVYSCRPLSTGLHGSYYDNKNWSGDVIATGLDTEFSTRTLAHIKERLGQNVFSIIWKGHLFIPETDLYQFWTNSDDGSELFIDGHLVVANGGDHVLKLEQGSIHLHKGLHSITIRYMQGGGDAALRVFWAQTPFPRAPMENALLLPEGSSVVRFQLYHNVRTLAPLLYAAWLFSLFALWFSSHRALRRQQQGDLFRHVRALFSRESAFGHALTRLFVQPLRFAAERIRLPQVYYWVIVALFSLLIFLTLAYARNFSNFMMGRYGTGIFSQITHYALLAAAVALFSYIFRLKGHRASRMLSLYFITVLYIFFLSPGFREHALAFFSWIGLHMDTIRDLEIYPLYAGEKIHFLEYGLLGLLLCKAFSYSVKNRSAYLLSLLLVYIIGMTDEGIQWALPQRVGEYRDIWLNITSGVLAILAVALVVRPRVFQENFRAASWRPVCYTSAAAVLYTAIFLQFVHGFGSSIFHPDSGSQFISTYSEERLLQIDKQLLQRDDGIFTEDLPRSLLNAYNYEARRHQELRDRYYQQERFFYSYCEQEILKTYFRFYLRKKNLQFFEYDDKQLQIAPDVNERIFYHSEAQELAITCCTQTELWLCAILTAALLCLLASVLPLNSGRSLSTHSKPEARFERLILRPFFCLVMLAALFAALRPDPKTRPRDYINLLLLTVESTQPDYWSAYGYEKNTTPFFDDLASQGVLFTNSIASSSWTIPGLTSLMTGLNPNVHGIDIRAKLMDPRIPTLFEALESHGYAIGDTSYTLTEPSINSVFKKKDISPDVALAEGRSEESYLLSWMEKHQDEPFFGWVHFHTTHLPYRAAPPYNQMFLEDVDPDVLQDEQIKFVTSNIIVRKGEIEFDTERHAPAIHALYAQVLRQQDAKIGKVVMKLKELGLLDNTLIVITADHGEEQLEHGFIGHASTSWDTTVYDDLIQIPLLVFYPRALQRGITVEDQVRQIDFMPTVLDLLEIPLAAQVQGQSYLPLLKGEGDFRPDSAFSETTPCGYSCPSRLTHKRLRSLRTNDWKLISVYDREKDSAAWELYNLKEDPAESKNVFSDHPDIVKLLQQAMQRWIDAPQDFDYHEKQQEGTHYLDEDVELRPIVLFPKVGTVLTPETHGKRVLVEWIGREDTEYIIEYEVGTGGYHMTGELEVTGPKQWYGPFPEDIWQALPLYNPWRFRIIPKAHRTYPSEWITFEMQNNETS
ncbi:hypothetical protein CSB45_14525 [candidate division KSB3 bacterium]|uniref:PA14 domain-containing protein n=1 Tax=candidate division KSB3 bacterium TaxID=2044937 RepID=A0A2G6E1A7_9BACT|nr:MAG: hypothetical protein CSB45_14525 [candidate division KSB3 bacterium]PIE28416.1 MAG: hypothetical protein CSA57_13965 [candidate division KSB3 bacterium]